MMTQVYSTLRVAPSDEGVLGVVIDAPPMNLIGPELVRDLVTLVRELESGEDVRVMVLESTDPDYFVPHVDLTKVAEYTAEAAKAGGPDDASLGMLWHKLSELPVVSIAKIRGRARGAGSELALACDMRFAARENAILGQIEVGAGATPGAGGVQHLARLLGRGRAMEAILGGDDFGAEVAERYGWINRALPDADLDAFAGRLARRIASFPADAVRSAKRVLNELTLPGADAIRADARRAVRASGRRPAKILIRFLNGPCGRSVQLGKLRPVITTGAGRVEPSAGTHRARPDASVRPGPRGARRRESRASQRVTYRARAEPSTTWPPGWALRAGAARGDAQGLVHGRQLIFMTQVGLVAHTADDHAGVMLPAERDGQPGPRRDRDVVPVCGKFPAQLDRPFRLGAGWLLITIDSHEHGDPREKMPCPLDDVEMTRCDGVEGAGIDACSPADSRRSDRTSSQITASSPGSRQVVVLPGPASVWASLSAMS
jgi:enoyl-CoA hydratase/carnithine racemase